MKSKPAFLLLLLSSLSLFGCHQDERPLSKSEAARQQSKSDSSVDFCELFDWYDDDECDTFCPMPDPDCGPASCPAPDDPEVHYISESLAECAAILFGCESWQTGFSDECGCGCLGPEEEPVIFCGGFGNLPCEEGFVCVDDPTDDCDLDDGADCGGMCVVEEEPVIFCGGFGNLPCEEGFVCVDDPTDDCDLDDGADCGGMCVVEG